jgi:predicted secreted protein
MKITVGTQIKHYNGENPTGYIWTIIVIEGKKLQSGERVPCLNLDEAVRLIKRDKITA